MYYFRSIIGALLLGVALEQVLHFVSGRQRFSLGDGIGMLMTAGMAVLLFAPALLDVIRGERPARKRGVIMLIVISAIATLFAVSNRSTGA